ncbi:hypothetical protein ACFL2K_02265, partial [Candidatus Margulisiibacteriota bacterium]
MGDNYQVSDQYQAQLDRLLLERGRKVAKNFLTVEDEEQLYPEEQIVKDGVSITKDLAFTASAPEVLGLNQIETPEFDIYNTNPVIDSKPALDLASKLIENGLINLQELSFDQIPSKVMAALKVELEAAGLPQSQMANLAASVIGQCLVQKGMSFEQVSNNVQVMQGTTLFNEFETRVLYQDDTGSVTGFSFTDKTSEGYPFQTNNYTNIEYFELKNKITIPRFSDYKNQMDVRQLQQVVIQAAVPGPVPVLYQENEIPLRHTVQGFENAHQYIDTTSPKLLEELENIFYPDKLEDLTKEEIITKIHNYMTANYEYKADVNGDQWAFAVDTLATCTGSQKGYGDCEDLAILEASLLAAALGPDADIGLLGVRQKGRRGPGHMLVNFTDENGIRRALDPTKMQSISNLGDVPRFKPNNYEIYFETTLNKTNILQKQAGFTIATDESIPQITNKAELFTTENIQTISEYMAFIEHQMPDSEVNLIIVREKGTTGPGKLMVTYTDQNDVRRVFDPLEKPSIQEVAVAPEFDPGQYDIFYQGYLDNENKLQEMDITVHKPLGYQPMFTPQDEEDRYVIEDTDQSVGFEMINGFDNAIYESFDKLTTIDDMNQYLNWNLNNVKSGGKYDIENNPYIKKSENGDYFIYDYKKIQEDIQEMMRALQIITTLYSVAIIVASNIESLGLQLQGLRLDENSMSKTWNSISEKLQDASQKITDGLQSEADMMIEAIEAKNTEIFNQKRAHVLGVHANIGGFMLDTIAADADTEAKEAGLLEVYQSKLAAAEEQYQSIVDARISNKLMNFEGLDKEGSNYSEMEKDIKALTDDEPWEVDEAIDGDGRWDENGDWVKNAGYVKLREDMIAQAYKSMDIIQNMFRAYLTYIDIMIQQREAAARSLDENVVTSGSLSAIASSNLESRAAMAKRKLGQVQKAALKVVEMKNRVNSQRITLEKMRSPLGVLARIFKGIAFWGNLIGIATSVILGGIGLIFGPVGLAIGVGIGMAISIGSGLIGGVGTLLQSIQESTMPQRADENQFHIDADEYADFVGDEEVDPDSYDDEDIDGYLKAKNLEDKLHREMFNMQNSMIDVGTGRKYIDWQKFNELQLKIKRLQEIQRLVYLAIKTKADIVATAAAELSEFPKQRLIQSAEQIIESRFTRSQSIMQLMRFSLNQKQWAVNLNAQVSGNRWKTWSDFAWSISAGLIPFVGSSLASVLSNITNLANPNNAIFLNMEALTGTSVFTEQTVDEMIAKEKAQAATETGKKEGIYADELSDLTKTPELALLYEASQLELQSTGAQAFGVHAMDIKHTEFNRIQKKLENIALRRYARMLIYQIFVANRMSTAATLKGSATQSAQAMDSAMNIVDRSNNNMMEALSLIKQHQSTKSDASRLQYKANYEIEKSVIDFAVTIAVLMLAAVTGGVGLVFLPFAQVLSSTAYSLFPNSAYTSAEETREEELEEEGEGEKKEGKGSEKEIINDVLKDPLVKNYGSTFDWAGGSEFDRFFGFGGSNVDWAKMTDARMRIQHLAYKRKAFMMALETYLSVARENAEELGAQTARYSFGAVKALHSYKKSSANAIIQNVFDSAQKAVERDLEVMQLKREAVGGMITGTLDLVTMIVNFIIDIVTAGASKGGAQVKDTGKKTTKKPTKKPSKKVTKGQEKEPQKENKPVLLGVTPKIEMEMPKVEIKQDKIKVEVKTEGEMKKGGQEINTKVTDIDKLQTEKV